MGSNYVANDKQIMSSVQGLLTGFKTFLPGMIEKRLIVMQEVSRSRAFLLAYADRVLAWTLLFFR